MKDKSIAEMIHDRAFAEGATLVVWTDTARFRRLLIADGQDRIRPRTLHVNNDLGSVSSSDEVSVIAQLGPVTTVRFDASEELMNLIRRNADELREYNASLVREWVKELTPCVGSSKRSASPLAKCKGRLVSECHAGITVAISSFLAVLSALCGRDGEIDELGARIPGWNGRPGVVWSGTYDFNVEMTGRGGGCRLSVVSK